MVVCCLCRCFVCAGCWLLVAFKNLEFVTCDVACVVCVVNNCIITIVNMHCVTSGIDDLCVTIVHVHLSSIPSLVDSMGFKVQ